MNNFKQKNKKLESQQLNEIAYSTFDNVKIPNSTLQNVAETYDADINNAFQQLVDNDLYLKRMFERNANYIEGPINYDPHDEASQQRAANAPNGSKFMYDDGTKLDILQKVESSIQESVTTQQNYGANWIHVFDGKYYVGTDDRILTCNANSTLSELQTLSDGKSNCYASDDTYVIAALGQSVLNISSHADTIQTSLPRGAGDINCICESKYELSSGDVEHSTYVATEHAILSGSFNASRSYDCIQLSNNIPSDKTVKSIAFLQRDGQYSIVGDVVIDQSTVSKSNNMLVATSQSLYRLNSIAPNGTFEFELVDSISEGSFVKFVKLGANDFLITTTKGTAYRYTLQKDFSIFCQVNDNNIVKLYDIQQIQTKDNYKYLASAEDPNTNAKKLVLSKNLRAWSDLINVSKHDLAAKKINCILFKNNAKILAASDSKTYETVVTYELSSVLNRFTADDAYDYLESDSIVEMISSQISEVSVIHIANDHNDKSFITELNTKYMLPDFSNLCAFTTTASADSNYLSSVHYDYIKQVKFFSTKNDGDVAVRVNSFATGYKDVAVDCDCIVKMWNSGLNELYISIPTTDTYYISHIYGTPNCNVPPDQLIKRQNLRQLVLQNPNATDTISSTISSYYTTVKISILSTQYEMDTVLGMQINGSSLPLNIYKDTTDADDMSQVMFHSYIEPSMVYDSLDISKTDNEFYTISACCFGTDAQSFKITYVTPTTRYYDGNMYTVTFHGKTEKTLDGSSSYVQKYRITGTSEDGKQVEIEQKPLRQSQFETGSSLLLLGWTTKRASNEVEFLEDQVLTVADFMGKTNLDLYAVWKSVDWTSCTTLELETDDNSKTIEIAEGKLISSAKDVVIDFGDE